MLKVTLLLLLTGLHTCLAGLEVEVNIASHLTHLGKHRYPNKTNEETRQEVLEYITDRFEEYGLRVDHQQIEAMTVPEPSSICTPKHKCLRRVKGVNVIGVSRQDSEEVEGVLVVAAPYDTDGVGSPTHKGAGVAVLLEVARLYQSMAPPLRLTTLFVALDLSLESYHINRNDNRGSDSVGGVAGGWYFVQDYFRSYVQHNISKFSGAIVIGPLVTFKPDDHSTGFDPRVQELFPDAYKEATQGDGSRGDFLAMVTRAREEDEKALILGREIADNYRQAGGRLVEFSLGSRPHTLLPATLHPRQASYFWGSTLNGHLSPLPAILLTMYSTENTQDTNSSNNIIFSDAQMAFLTTTITSLTKFLQQRQFIQDWWEAGLLGVLFASCFINILLSIHLCHTFCCSTNSSVRRHISLRAKDALTFKGVVYVPCENGN